MKPEFWASEDLLKNIHEAIVNQRRCIAYTVADKSIVFISNKGNVDEQLCYDLGYSVYEAMYNGGVIVADIGDIDIAYFGEPGNTFYSDFGNTLAEWLRGKGLNAEYVANDVLVDGYKISGNGVIRHSGMDYTVVHIGINTNVESIKNICKKPMNKVPKGLSEYGITTEEVEEMFLNFCEHDEILASK